MMRPSQNEVKNQKSEWVQETVPVCLKAKRTHRERTQNFIPENLTQHKPYFIPTYNKTWKIDIFF